MQLLHCEDNLDYLRGMDAGSVDLVYLDPPYYSQRDYGEFDDRWKSRKDYLDYMTAVLELCSQAMKPTASIYLQCDDSINYRLRMLLDDVFGIENFRNEIVWCYTCPSNTKRFFPRKHDTLLFYSQSNEYTFNFNEVRVPYVKFKTGKTSGIFKEDHTLNLDGKIPESWWTKFSPVGRIAKERTGYPTQKPLVLLERIIKASSNEGDLVLDPFLGSGTTAVACKRLNRYFVGIDKNPKSIEITKRRLQEILI